MFSYCSNLAKHFKHFVVTFVWRSQFNRSLTTLIRSGCNCRRYWGQCFWSNYSDLALRGCWGREIPLFQGNLGWWNVIIWLDCLVVQKTCASEGFGAILFWRYRLVGCFFKSEALSQHTMTSYSPSTVISKHHGTLPKLLSYFRFRWFLSFDSQMELAAC